MAFFGGINTNKKKSTSKKTVKKAPKSLSDFRRSVGLDKDKNKGIKTIQDSDKLSVRQKDRVDQAQGLADRYDKEGVKSTDEGIRRISSKYPTQGDFFKDLKDAYKSGLFTGGNKTKDLMFKYGLSSDQIRDLRVGIDQGLGTRIGDGGNILSDILKDRKYILAEYSGNYAADQDDIRSSARNIYKPGMSRFDKLPIYENPEGIFQTAANFTNQYNPILRGFDLLAGGSSQGMRGLYYGRNELGLEGEELNNFAASVANDRDLYNQMMTTPIMKEYELNEFRAEANKNAMAQRRGDGDRDPISGSQGGEGDDGDDGATDPGTDPTYTPPPQNYYTFFDPDMGKYRSGTYDEYLQYVTAKDGGIIQLENGGTPPNAPGGVLPQGRKEQLEDLFKARREIQNLDTPTDSERKGSSMIMAEIDDRAKDISDISKEGIMMAMRDQPAKDLFAANNPDIGPALREDLTFPKKIGDSAMSLFMEAVRKNDITQGSANQFIEEALNNFVAAGIIPPNTSYDQLTDPFKDLVTREAAMIANSENMRAQEIGMQGPTIDPQTAPYIMQEGKPEDLQQMKPFMFGPTPDYTDRPLTGINTPDIRMYEVADGGIIGLKDGGMNDMMEADSLMFKDPSDEGEWEYNV